MKRITMYEGLMCTGALVDVHPDQPIAHYCLLGWLGHAAGITDGEMRYQGQFRGEFKKRVMAFLGLEFMDVEDHLVFENAQNKLWQHNDNTEGSWTQKVEDSRKLFHSIGCYPVLHA